MMCVLVVVCLVGFVGGLFLFDPDFLESGIWFLGWVPFLCVGGGLKAGWWGWFGGWFENLFWGGLVKMLSYAFTLSLFLISSINTINTLDLKNIYGVDFWLPRVSAVFSSLPFAVVLTRAQIYPIPSEVIQF